MDKKAVIKLCKDLGCCDACCVRLLGLKVPSAYENPRQYISTINEKVEPSKAPVAEQNNMSSDPLPVRTPDSRTLPNDAINNSETNIPEGNGHAPTQKSDTVDSEDGETQKSDTVDSEDGETQKSDTVDSEDGETPAKRCKVEGVCVTCIGILQEESWPETLNMVKEMLDKKNYGCDTFACALSSPICTIPRERVVTLMLEAAVKDYDAASVTPLKEAWKWSLGGRLARRVGKALDSGAVCPLLVTVNIEYVDDLQDLEVLKSLSPGLFASRSQQRRRFAVQFTRRCAEQALEGATVDKVRAVPGWENGPPTVSARAKCVSVCCTHAPVYLGGRYIKLSRSLPQTPWLVGGKRQMESSVQEIIFEPLAAMYGLSPEQAEHCLKFLSAGREDVDVRCLGDGRPFALEVLDPRRAPSAAELRAACAAISSSGKVVVKELVPINREDLSELKKGEETKTKTYEALCIKLAHSNNGDAVTDGSPPSVTQADMDRVNTYRNTVGDVRVTISQKTPVRVLHRRPLLDRVRRIYELQAELVPEHPQLFVVRVRTEAGTYVKEWAHGSLGRSRPALGDALGAPADILALDVAAVSLQWPPAP